MNVDRKKITGGGINMHKGMEIKRQDPCLRNELKSYLLECQLENRVGFMLLSLKCQEKEVNFIH